MDSIQTLTTILSIVLAAMIVLLLVLVGIFAINKIKKQNVETKNNNKKDANGKKIKEKVFKVESVNDFMDFDTIVDNMISQKNGMRYIMVVECQGINYDLMSDVEKNSVEDGFLQFLNTIRHPIQLYVQTRTINLNESIETYKNKVKEIEMSYEKVRLKYEEAVKSGRYGQDQLEAMYYELTKQRNLSEYGKDIIYNTEKMSLNKNVLNKKYYVIIPYYLDEIGDMDKFSKEEKRNMAFSELYTRSQSVIRTLSVCGINSRILNSEELAELLYMSYNRDEAEIYGMDKAIRAGYDELYTTAEEVIDKKMKVLDKEIGDKAWQKAKEKVQEAKSEKEKEYEEREENQHNYIAELAKLIVEKNEKSLGKDVSERAIKKLNEEKTKGGKINDISKEKEKTRRTV